MQAKGGDPLSLHFTSVCHISFIRSFIHFDLQRCSCRLDPIFRRTTPGRPPLLCRSGPSGSLSHGTPFCPNKYQDHQKVTANLSVPTILLANRTSVNHMCCYESGIQQEPHSVEALITGLFDVRRHTCGPERAAAPFAPGRCRLSLKCANALSASRRAAQSSLQDRRRNVTIKKRIERG